jgi:4-deoxy-L-threo-5-hexosulose-uronate ketol-isomerase
MRILEMADRMRYSQMTTDELRRTFLIEDLFAPGQVALVYVDLDRTVVGSAVPLEAPLTLPAPDALRASYFTERRELGILNVGGPGFVVAGTNTFPLNKLDCLYVGRGEPSVIFHSDKPAQPAEFYLLSYPAHTSFPARLSKAAELEGLTIGAPETASRRTIRKHIHLEGVRSCQLVMGFTQLAPGSIWNTMPPHTHMRRSEVYFYFDIPEEHRVLHLMGKPGETRHLVVADRQAVVSPGWSIHAGVGTTAYGFCWGMGGENQVYNDMDAVSIAELR